MPRHPAVAPLNPRIRWRKNSREPDQSHRGRHRYRRNHTAGWRRSLYLGGPDRRTFRRPPSRAGVGRRPGCPYRGADRRGAGRGHPPPAGPPPGPLGAVRADRGQGGLGERRFHRQGGRGPERRPRPAGHGHRLRHRWCDDPARPVRRAEGEGRTPCLPAHRSDADAERSVRQRGTRRGRPRRCAHPGLRLRLRRRGHRLRHRDDPHGPRRRRRRRWHRGGHPPASHRRVRQHDGDVQEQRRPRGCLAHLRRRP